MVEIDDSNAALYAAIGGGEGGAGMWREGRVDDWMI